MAAEKPRYRITLDYVEVMQDKGGLNYVTTFACLMAIYFIYNIQYAAKVNNTIQFIQYHMLHMNKKKCTNDNKTRCKLFVSMNDVSSANL